VLRAKGYADAAKQSRTRPSPRNHFRETTAGGWIVRGKGISVRENWGFVSRKSAKDWGERGTIDRIDIKKRGAGVWRGKNGGKKCETKSDEDTRTTILKKGHDTCPGKNENKKHDRNPSGEREKTTPGGCGWGGTAKSRAEKRRITGGKKSGHRTKMKKNKNVDSRTWGRRNCVSALYGKTCNK